MTYEEFWAEYQRQLKKYLHVFFSSDEEWDQYIQGHMAFQNGPKQENLRVLYDMYVQELGVDEVYKAISSLVYNAQLSY